MFFITVGIVFCLSVAAFAVMCMTGFKRLVMRDIDHLANMDTQKHALHLKCAQIWRTYVLQQDRVVSVFFAAYIMMLIAAVTLLAHYGLNRMPAMTVMIHIIWVSLVFLLVSYFLPKSFVLRRNSDFILKFFVPFRAIYHIFLVPVWLVTALGNNIVALLPQYFQPVEHLISAKRDMNFVVRYRGMLAAQDKEALQKSRDQRRMAKALDDYLKKTVIDIMMPVADIPMLNGEQPMEDLIEEVMNRSESRIIVYQETPDQIIGVLHVDLFLKALAMAEGDWNSVDFVSALSEPLCIGPQSGIADQIKAFQQSKESFALVRDVRGTLMGGVSLDQLLTQTAMMLQAEPEAPPKNP